MNKDRISSEDLHAPHSPFVTIKLDGNAREVAAGSTLAELVAELGHEEKSVSTAVNGAFVARSERGRELHEGDSVLLFQPIVGG